MVSLKGIPRLSPKPLGQPSTQDLAQQARADRPREESGRLCNSVSVVSMLADRKPYDPERIAGHFGAVLEVGRDQWSQPSSILPRPCGTASSERLSLRNIWIRLNSSLPTS